MRVEIGVSRSSGTQSKLPAVLVARREIPGVLIEVSGENPALVQGTADLMYWRLYSGYVDRLGSWRALAAMLMPSLGVLPVVFVVDFASDLPIGLFVLAIVRKCTRRGPVLEYFQSPLLTAQVIAWLLRGPVVVAAVTPLAGGKDLASDPAGSTER